MVKKKHLLISCGFFLGVIVLILGARNFFINRFNSLEKKQDEILAELLKLQVTPSPLPTSSSEDVLGASDAATLATIQEIGRMKKSLIRVESELEKHDDILGFLDSTAEASTPLATPVLELHFVTITDKRWQTLDVFKNKNNSSTIIGQAVYGQAYPYTLKENDYYYITLKDGVNGWIHKQFVKEY